MRKILTIATLGFFIFYPSSFAKADIISIPNPIDGSNPAYSSVFFLAVLAIGASSSIIALSVIKSRSKK